MLGRARRQALQLERYWVALRHDRTSQPPPTLDAAVADTAAWLAELTAELQPPAAAISSSRARVVGAAAELAVRRAWTGPEITPHARPLGAEPDHDPVRAAPPAHSARDIFNLEERPSRRRQLAQLFAAVIVFGLVTAGLVLLLRPESSRVAAPSSVATPAEMPATSTVPAITSATPPPTPNVRDLGSLSAIIPVSADPFDVVFAAGSVWVSDVDTGTVSRIDPSSNTIVATIALGTSGAVATFLTATDTAVWAVNESELTVVQIDPTTNQVVTSFALPQVGSDAFQVRGMAVGHDSLWLTHFAATGRVVRINPETGAIEAEFAVSGPRGIAVSEDAVWVADVATDVLARIDPLTNQIVATVQVGDAPVVVAVSAAAVWVGNRGSSSVSRVDPLTNAVVATIAVNGSETAAIQPGALAVEPDAVWVADEKDPGLFHIDPVTNAVVASAPITVSRMAIGEGDLWIGSPADGAVLRIAPSS